MAANGSVDIKCPKCKMKLGSKPASQNSGGKTLLCSKCHLVINFGFDKNRVYVKNKIQK